MRAFYARLIATFFGIILWSSTAFAQEFPSKTVRIIVPFGAGSGLDTVTLLIAVRLAKEWGQPVVVENRPGASGVIGTEHVFRAPSDGYTLLATTQSLYTGSSLVSKLAYDPAKDFVPVARISSANLVMVVSSNSSLKSVQELLAEARAKPGSLTYATLGVGSTAHLAGALLSMVGGVELMPIHYKETSQASSDTINSTVAVNFVAISTATSQIKAGKLRPLAVTGGTRSVALPEVPTVSELALPAYEFSAWHGLFVRSNTPNITLRKISEDIGKIASSSEFQTLLHAQGLDPSVKGPNELGAQLTVEVQRLFKIMADSGIKKD